MHKEILNLLDENSKKKGVVLSAEDYIKCFAALYYTASVTLIVAKKIKKEVLK